MCVNAVTPVRGFDPPDQPEDFRLAGREVRASQSRFEGENIAPATAD
jgi:hypothetical protein